MRVKVSLVAALLLGTVSCSSLTSSPPPKSSGDEPSSSAVVEATSSAAPTSTSVPIAVPVDAAALDAFLRAWARHGIGCWTGMIPAAVVSALPDTPGECFLPNFLQDGPYVAGHELLRNLMSKSPTDAARRSFGLPGTCPRIWHDTAASILDLDDEAERAVTVPYTIWHSSVDAGIVSNSLRYLFNPRQESDCSPALPAGLTQLDVRINVAADAAAFDRELGGWFGRSGGRSSDVLTAGEAGTTWGTWHRAVLLYAVNYADPCYAGLTSLFDAAGTLAVSAEAVWRYAWGLRDNDFASYYGDVNTALDRQLPKALAILESCGP
jgi:hypothetical protein